MRPTFGASDASLVYSGKSAEMVLGRVLFQGSSTLNQLDKIFEVLGRPTEEDLKDINSPTSKTLLSAIEMKHISSLENVFEHRHQVTSPYVRTG